ncbi:DUF58 domain-containing protein [uncultured Jatrophihabitans sp.]|uniref:DUF58 domain-containing protein n=1 Tax=uncultured Jatrophihabitans sp. TaxID=1610747 RepID=UPI0035C9A025
MARRRPGFTTRGTCLLAAGATAVLCGLLFGQSDLVRAGVLAAAVPCAAAVVVHRSRVGIANSRNVEPADVSAGHPVTVRLTIINRSALRSGTLMLEDTLPRQVRGRARFVLDPLAAREERPVTYRIPRLARGRYRVGPLRVRLTDPFRMVDLTRSFTAYDDFVVTPVVDPLPAVEPPRGDDLGDSAGSRSVGSHGADDQSTREYRTGDDLRKIHWRSSARTGALMVRQEERPWQGQATVVLDTRAAAHVGDASGSDDDPRTTDSFEWAVSAAASIATHAIASGRRVGIVDRLTLPQPLHVGDPRAVARRLSDATRDERGDLAQISALLRSAAQESTLIAVLGRIDAAALRALLAARAGGHSSPALAVLLDTETWTMSDELAGAPRTEPTPSTATTAAAALRAAGWRVSVVRCGDTTAQAWQLLLAGYTVDSRSSALSR